MGIILELCNRQVDVLGVDEEACLICGRQLRLQMLLDHLAAHMEDIALFVLNSPPIPEENDQRVMIETVPLVQLRHPNEEEGERVSDIPTQPCASCDWDGAPRRLYKTISHLSTMSRKMHSLSAISPSCACCQVIDILYEHLEAADATGNASRTNMHPGQPFILCSTIGSPINAYDFLQRNSTGPGGGYVNIWDVDDLKEARGWSVKFSSDRRDSINTQGYGRFIPRRLINVGSNDHSPESTVVKLEDVSTISM